MNNRPTNEINTLSLHDALPISQRCRLRLLRRLRWGKLLRGRVRRQARALLQRRAGRWPTGRQPSQLRVGRKPVSASQMPQLAVGDRVTHDSFGMGTVSEVAGQGEKTQVEVAFKAPHGTKRLLLRYAPLTKL